MPKEDTQFSKDNQPKGRGKGRKSLMLEAIKAECTNEHEFLRKVIRIGLGELVDVDNDDDKEKRKEIYPNPQLLNMVLSRIEPPFKAVAPMVEFDFDTNAKPHEQASQILKAVSDSLMAPDIGQMFIASIKSMIDIEEYTDLKERIEKLEKALSGES